MLVEVALRIYNSVSLLKMIRTLLADSISMMRKGSNTCVCGTGLPLCYKLKEPGVIHVSDNKIKYKAQYDVVASKDIILVGAEVIGLICEIGLYNQTMSFLRYSSLALLISALVSTFLVAKTLFLSPALLFLIFLLIYFWGLRFGFLLPITFNLLKR